MHYERKYFEDRKLEFDKIVKELEKTSGRYSLLRLFIFVLIVIMIILAFAVGYKTVFFSVAGVLFVAFVYLCVKHRKTSSELKIKTELLHEGQIGMLYFPYFNTLFLNPLYQR